MDIADLERRVTIQEDIEAIKQLKARYCAVCDDDHNTEKITTLFVEDGIWEGADLGSHQGHDAIRALFQSFKERISFSQHNVMNPIIEVNGDRATGTWYLLGPFTFRKGNRAIWLAARYDYGLRCPADKLNSAGCGIGRCWHGNASIVETEF
jgi:hypothetical protein